MARGAGIQTPYSRIVAVTASDTVAIATGVTDAIIFTTGGNATVVDASGNTISFVAVPAGAIVEIAVVRVNATGLTAVVAALYAI